MPVDMTAGKNSWKIWMQVTFMMIAKIVGRS
jgi:hypothetical protein